MKNKYSDTIDLILASIGHDAYTCADLESRLQMERLSPVISRMHTKHLIYIVDYKYDDTFQRRYPRALYAVGNMADAQRPTEFHPREPRCSAIGRIPSIFHLGAFLHSEKT